MKYIIFGLISLAAFVFSVCSKPSLTATVEQIGIRAGEINRIGTYPKLDPFIFPNKVPRLDSHTFVQVGHIRPNVPIEQVEWNEYFKDKLANDTTGKWQRLKEFFESNLTDVTVFKTGHLVKIVYLTGYYEGYIIGTKMIVIEQ